MDAMTQKSSQKSKKIATNLFIIGANWPIPNYLYNTQISIIYQSYGNYQSEQ